MNIPPSSFIWELDQCEVKFIHYLAATRDAGARGPIAKLQPLLGPISLQVAQGKYYTPGHEA